MQHKKKECEIHPVSPNDKVDPSAAFVNTTSRSKEHWSTGLSPFFLGPIKLYGSFEAKNMENAWQYAKVYKDHVDPETGEPNEEYWKWAQEGWANPSPVRFPRGRGAIPEYSYWDGKKYDYIAARKLIYCALYSQLVEKTEAFARLKRIYEESEKLYLWDFDGYDYLKMGRTLQQVINDPKRKMGHCFVLTMMLKGERLWEGVHIPCIENYQPNPKALEPKEKKGPSVSPGLLVKSQDKYLLCRSAWTDEGEEEQGKEKESQQRWSIPKGWINSGEASLDAAVRILNEQTGIDLLSSESLQKLIPPSNAEPFKSWHVGRKSSGKTITVYLVDDQEGILQGIPLACSVLIQGDYVPATLRGKPEFDAFRWVSETEAAELVYPSLKPLFGGYSPAASGEEEEAEQPEPKVSKKPAKERNKRVGGKGKGRGGKGN